MIAREKGRKKGRALKACNYCLGDLIKDEVIGQVGAVCTQCGFPDLSMAGNHYVEQEADRPRPLQR
ncbi:MAG TPA: hypothetical protein VNL15_00295 [Dehalococcoidia bacterium]|nr:hypothetical protein [Dehalococcoidia bacterium]